MPIFKIQQKYNYASIPNATLRDKRLSIEARGVLAYMLTHTDTFELSFEFLQKELSVGRDKLKNIVRELKQNGYLCLVAAHNKKGSFSGQEWFVFAECQDADFTVQTYDRLTEKPSDVKTVRRENRQTENPSDNIKEKSSQKKSQEENNSLSPRRRELSVDEAVEVLEADQELPSKPKTKAIEIYEDVFPNHFLDGDAYDDFAARLPEVVESVWRQTLMDWRLARYKASNIPGMINKYERTLNEVKNAGISQKSGIGGTARNEFHPKLNQKSDADVLRELGIG